MGGVLSESNWENSNLSIAFMTNDHISSTNDHIMSVSVYENKHNIQAKLYKFS